jgi:hypothetical protein
MKFCWGGKSENRKVRNFSVCGATTSDAMAKWRLPSDLTRQIGLGSTSHEDSECSRDVETGGEEDLAKF